MDLRSLLFYFEISWCETGELPMTLCHVWECPDAKCRQNYNFFNENNIRSIEDYHFEELYTLKVMEINSNKLFSPCKWAVNRQQISGVYFCYHTIPDPTHIRRVRMFITILYYPPISCVCMHLPLTADIMQICYIQC